MTTRRNIHRILPALLAAALLAAAARGQQFTDLSVSNELKIEMTPGSPNMIKLLSNGAFFSIRPNPDGVPIWSLNNYPLSTAFFYEPGRGALRSGYFSGPRLEGWNMGHGSTAIGYETFADYMGFAGGMFSQAGGGGGFAFGQYSVTGGPWAVAMGDGCSALAGWSVAIGGALTATGGASAALNAYNLAAGDYSFAAGLFTRADAKNSFVIGRMNVGGAGPGGGTQWIPTDPIFEIGIGEDPWTSTVRRNALTVYKDGRVVIHKAQGDILMGEFGN